jgi:hypothetical protein
MKRSGNVELTACKKVPLEKTKQKKDIEAKLKQGMENFIVVKKCRRVDACRLKNLLIVYRYTSVLQSCVASLTNAQAFNSQKVQFGPTVPSLPTLSTTSSIINCNLLKCLNPE